MILLGLLPMLQVRGSFISTSMTIGESSSLQAVFKHVFHLANGLADSLARHGLDRLVSSLIFMCNFPLCAWYKTLRRLFPHSF